MEACYQPGSHLSVHALQIVQNPGELLAAGAEVMLGGELQKVDWPMFKGVPTQHSEVGTIGIHTVFVELPVEAQYQPKCVGWSHDSKSTCAVALEQRLKQAIAARNLQQQSHEDFPWPVSAA